MQTRLGIMSLKLAIAKLSAAAAGVALLQGGAVRVAEPMNTDAPEFTTGKEIEADPVTGQRYVKNSRMRALPAPEPVRRRIVERTIECQPVGFGGVGASSMPGNIVQTYADANECPPIAQVAYMPAPLPPASPVQGGGGFGGGFGGFGGGFGGFGGGLSGGLIGGFFGGGGAGYEGSSGSTGTANGGKGGGATSTMGGSITGFSGTPNTGGGGTERNGAGGSGIVIIRYPLHAA
jgi:hypothetical protein